MLGNREDLAKDIIAEIQPENGEVINNQSELLTLAHTLLVNKCGI